MSEEKIIVGISVIFGISGFIRSSSNYIGNRIGEGIGAFIVLPLLYYSFKGINKLIKKISKDKKSKK